MLDLPRGALGSIVDAVDRIQSIPAERIEPLPAALASDGLGERVAAVGEQLIVLIDPEKALAEVLGPARPTRRRGKTT